MMPEENTRPVAVQDQRPMRILNALDLREHVEVRCRVNGEEVYVPLKILFALFQQDQVSKAQIQRGGHRYGHH